jgi:aspartate aminotransferase-like enzyme
MSACPLTPSDDQLVEALKSKKFKVVTITHGESSSLPVAFSSKQIAAR